MKIEQVLSTLGVNQNKLSKIVGVERSRVSFVRKNNADIPELWHWKLNAFMPSKFSRPDLFPEPNPKEVNKQ